MNNQVNYIIQHKEASSRLVGVKKFTSCHIAVYNALFLVWNQSGFPDELSIVRSEIMAISKVGSANTYTKVLKDLQAENFITYKPSYNPLIPSIVEIYKFDKGVDKGTGKGTDKGDATYNTINIETIKLLDKETFVSFLEEGKLSVEDLKKLKSEIESCLPKDKPKKKEPSESELSVHALTKAVFMNEYKNRKGSEYIWSKKDGAMLKDLISKLVSKLRTHEPNFDPEVKKERIPNGLQFLLTGVKSGSWYDEHFEIAILNSKFNEIYAIALKEKEQRDNAAKPKRTISDAIIEARGF